jgi:membrane-associated phospholipid phosphatase
MRSPFTSATPARLEAAPNALRRLDPMLQIGLVIGLAEIYRLLRRLIPTDWPVAIANAHHVLQLERALHIDWEDGMQHAFLRHPELLRGMNWFYLSSHFVVTGLFFVWLYWRNRNGFAIYRDGFLLGTAIALVIHWRYPTAPPRLAHVGVLDTISLYSHVNIGAPHHERFSNPVAAVPSLHAGWALAIGAGLALYARTRLAKVLGGVYSFAVLITVIVTGNHFVFDLLAGAVVMALGFAATAPFHAHTADPAYERP